jgi:hypothetical protein
MKLEHALRPAALSLLAMLVQAGFAGAQNGGAGETQASPPSAQATPPEEKPVATPKAKPGAEALSMATASAALFTPAMRTLLQNAYDPKGRQLFSGGDNFTVISVPDQFAVYIADVKDIQAAAAPGEDPAVEEALFQPSRLVGDAPLTLQLAPGDYVVGVRATKRGDGFDGGCISKSTRDPITGGAGRAYHLYGVSKRPGKYLCLLANFAGDTAQPDDLGEPAASAGIFQAGAEQIAALMSGGTHIPSEKQARLGDALLRSGRAYYAVDDVEYYARLGIEGAELTLQEWPVE